MVTQLFFMVLGVFIYWYILSKKHVKISHPVLVVLGIVLVGGYIGGVIAASLGEKVPTYWQHLETQKVASIRTIDSPESGHASYAFMYKYGRSSFPEIADGTKNEIGFTPTSFDYAEVKIWKNQPVGIFEPFVFFEGHLFYEFFVLEKDMPKGMEIH